MPAITIPFHGDRLLGVQNEQGDFVYLKSISDQLGLDWSAQFRRVNRDPLLREGIAIMAIPPEFGGANDAVFLRLDLFHGWLFKVSISRVAKDHRERLTIYQRDAYAVLHAAFGRKARPSPRKQLSAAAEDRALKRVREARLSLGIRAAQEVWRTSGLPVPKGFETPEQPDLLDASPGRSPPH